MSQKKLGRPKAYPGETPTRMTVSLRPRYKKAIEMLAQDRGTSLNEAVEFCIAYTSANVIFDGKPLIYFIRPDVEPFNFFVQSLPTFFDISPEFDGEYRSNTGWGIDNIKLYDEYLSEIQSKPKSLWTSLDRTMHDVISSKTTDVLNCFRFRDLINAILECWKEGISAEIMKEWMDICAEYIAANKYVPSGTLIGRQSPDQPYAFINLDDDSQN
ncbi:hypothetical protein [Snodgrassella sp. CFCC 13594]|uniref:hypothetical protein n=1 Tax=Snodgrassella sp. CFCC 13594 TaxID=1775559 RepID=UPI00083053DC|nr:hypothetical protein [Snodgrassella sp. CFCC 13594]